MPGVPSGRGCDGCRKQKKKCDQGQPSCSRCSRLGLTCIGSGQQRFKWIDDSKSSGTNSLVHKARKTDTPVLNIIDLQCVALMFPSNDLSIMTGSWISVMENKDVRYDLSTYGGFLMDIPRRLGSSAALDASVKSFMASCGIVQSRQRSAAAYESYIDALKALRASINDPSEAGSSNTMCAIYLLIICQGWIGQRDDCITGHGEALSHLLSNVSLQGHQDEFEHQLKITLCVIVIIESIGNPRIQLQPWLSKLTETRDNLVPVEGLKLSHMARISDFIFQPELHLFEIKSAYQRMGIDLPTIRTCYAAFASISSQGSQPAAITMRARMQTALSLLLSSAVILNTLLRIFEPLNLYLIQESTLLADEIIALAKDATQYRPLGSSSMPLTLIAAWASTDDELIKAQAEDCLAVYQEDFTMSRWMDIAHWLDWKLHLAQKPLVFDQQIQEKPKSKDQICCVM